MKKDVLPAAGKESTGVISKTMLNLNKGSIGILYGEPLHVHIEKHFRGVHIPQHAQFKVII
jgi:hypothetical protein